MEKKTSVYLDHNATTPLAAELVPHFSEFALHWGNPSSIHWASREPKKSLRECRQALAKWLSINPLEIVFTSGGSEGNNTIIKGVFDYFSLQGLSGPHRNHFMCSSVEHPSVLKTMKYLETRGAKVDFIPVNRRGEIDHGFFMERISEQTALVSMMLANNETGSVFPIKKYAEIAHRYGALFHTDSVQALGKLEINLQDLGVDYASFSGHKFYLPKGIGWIYCKKNAPFMPLIHGGAQERHRRGGTENTLGIMSLGWAMEHLAPNLTNKIRHLESLRNRFEKFILEKIPGVRITAVESERLPNTSSLVIPQVDGETLLMSLDLRGFAVSTGAACSSGSPEPSPVLMSIGLSHQEAQSSLRVSFGWENTQEQVDDFVNVLKSEVERLRKISIEVEEDSGE